MAMTREESIKTKILAQFGFAEEQIRLPRERRIFLEVAPQQFRTTLEYVVKTLEFRHLCSITGLDEGDNLGFFYHLARLDGMVLSLKTTAPKSNPAHPTVSDLFPGGVIYERELEDLLGAKIEGLPPGPRYPLPDSWPCDIHPLRKEFSAEMLDRALQAKEVTNHG